LPQALMRSASRYDVSSNPFTLQFIAEPRVQAATLLLRPRDDY